MFPKLLKLSIIAVLFFGVYHYSSASFTVSRPPTLNSGLVGYWTFDGADTNFTTNTVADKSGNNNTGAMTNMSTSTARAPGKIGQAFRFDGVNDRVDISDPSSGVLDFGTGSFSISLWTKINNPNSGSKVLFDKHTSPGNPAADGSGYQIFTHTTATGGLRFYIRDGTNNRNIDGPSGYDIRNGSWHFVTVIVNRTNQLGTVYVDTVGGSQADISTVGDLSNNANFEIMGSSDGTLSLDGLIDEVRVYNRALSASEVKTLYNQGASKFNVSPVKTLTAGLVGYWTFDGADTNFTTNTVADKSGQGNTGTMINMSTSTARAPGKIGQALRFDGVDDYVDVGTGASLDVSNNITLSAWVKPFATTGTDEKIFDKRNSWVSLTGYSFFISGNHLFMEYGNDTSSNQLSASNVVSRNTWQHFLVSINNGIVSWYKNGAVVKTQSALSGMGINAVRASIGYSIGRSGLPFPGLIDEVRIYNRALSTSEVKQLYNMGR